MRNRKILISLILSLLFLAILGSVSKVNAAYDATGKILGIELNRASGYGYVGLTNSKVIWKIAQYSSNSSSTPDFSKPYYCIKAGPGFGSSSSMGSSITKKLYQYYFDLKDKSSIPAPYVNALPTTTANYNSLLWLLDNVYMIPGANASTDEKNAAALQKEALKNSIIAGSNTDGAYDLSSHEFSSLTDDDIDVVQQLAIWHFTNPGSEYDAGTVSATGSQDNQFSIKLGTGSDTSAYLGYATASDQLYAVNQLYKYFVYTATQHSGSYTPVTNANPITFTKNNAKSTYSNNGFIVGPYKLSASATNYTINGYTITDQNNTAITGAKLQVKSGNTFVDTSYTLQQLITSGTEFYIYVPASSKATSCKFEYSLKVSGATNITYWAVANAPTSEQPVVTLDKEAKNYSASDTQPLNTPTFDLALRKFITAINGTSPTVSRVPSIASSEISALAAGSKTTATKVHPKDPLTVSQGDTVLYTIRIYNEGGLGGYATEVTDFLPAGLSLKSGSTINSQFGWTANGQTIKTAYLANRKIDAFNGTTLDFEDLQIECTVTAAAAETEQTLKNVAEITAHKDENGNTNASGLDRDSTPGSLTSTDVTNYGTTSKQDDDDFEVLKMLPKENPKYFDLALRKFITSIDDNAPATSRVPAISSDEISKLAAKTSTTAEKVHPKNALEVNQGSTVIYTLRIYNEGDVDGYATEITDYLPAGLSLKSGSTINGQYGWTANGQTVKTTYLSDKLIKAFNGTTLDYKDIQIECTVTAQVGKNDQSLKNVAEITGHKDVNGNTSVTDRDSVPGSLTPTDVTNYGTTSKQDDDDFEQLILKGKEFDLALRKFIISINGTAPTVSRDPVIAASEVTALKNGSKTTANKVHPKNALTVATGDKVIYTLRVYNEGSLDGYVTEITDHLPTGLTLTPSSTVNTRYGWTASADGKTIKTTVSNDKLIKAVTSSTTLQYVDVQVECTVTAEQGSSEKELKNVAEITAHKDVNGNVTVTDRDSTPNNLTDTQITNYGTTSKEDDDDFEVLKLPAKVEQKYFDLALRKFITSIDDNAPTTSRVPQISQTEISKLANKTATTAEKVHPKNALEVNQGSTVIYTLRIYNEGDIDGYATEVTDYLPSGLSLKSDSTINAQYGWTANGQTVKTTYLADKVIKAFNGTTLDYKDIQIECTVTAQVKQSDQSLKNVAEITGHKDVNGNTTVTDRDSVPGSLTPTDVTNYGTTSKQDDDDFEQLILKGKKFDLALRKFITSINNVAPTTSRVPAIADSEVTALKNGTKTTATKVHPKNALVVAEGDRVVYTLRVYNEGEIDGYVTEITDHLPTGLTLTPNSTINMQNGWTASADGRTIKTSKTQTTLLKAVTTSTTLQYVDVQIECTVTAKATDAEQSLKNIAEITGHKDFNGNTTVTDRDSTPNNLTDTQITNYGTTSKEDDDDFEELKIIPDVKYFDIALRKFIVSVNGTAVSPSREPVIAPSEITALANGSITTVNKVHTKTPVQVAKNDKVIYTLRVYNEGQLDGFAGEITDYLPEGLTLTPDSTTNTKYGWTAEGQKIKSTYLSNTLLNAFDGTTIKYADIQIECTVTASAKVTNTQLKNIAEISKYLDKDKKTVEDIDSTENNVVTPGYNGSQEDDDDFEDLIIPGQSFDLALRKFITTVNGTAVSPSRVPTIADTELNKLTNGTTTTVQKVHTKTPVQVAVGDKVKYTIRIYNEGSLDGYAMEVTDYLPAGLKFDSTSAINTQYGWTADGQTIKTNYLKDTLLHAYPYNNGLDYADLQIECIVDTNVVTDNIKLKNIAEITEDADENKNPIDDVDSTPKNVVTPGYNGSQEDDDDYEDLVIPGKYFDLALRKSIESVNGTNTETSRLPVVDVTNLKNGSSTTATYSHMKAPVSVKVGDIVIYTIRVYNEGQIDGYANEVTDYLPPYLEFVTDDADNFNAKYGWLLQPDMRTVKTSFLSKETDDDNVIKAYNGGDTLDYKELKIKCRVKSDATPEYVMTNIAEITNSVDLNGNNVTDRDSVTHNEVLPTDENLPSYKGNTSNKSDLGDSGYFYKGQEDDDDFEKIRVQQFDLALRKFITKVNTQNITDRVPVFTGEVDKNGNYIYNHTKEPVKVQTADIVTYTIRVFNEGDINGYAKEVKDNIPQGLEFVKDNETNTKYGWKLLDENGTETTDVSKAKYIVTDYLSKDKEAAAGDNMIPAFTRSSMTSPAYKDVQVAFKVVEPNTSSRVIINTAEISDDTDEHGNPVDDVDSTPDNDKPEEDDIDKEYVKLESFDLALRKFITQVNENAITNRVPVFTGNKDENGNYIYDHTKTPVEVENGNIVTYTIRVFNEGTMAGYAQLVKDDMPQGIEFLPQNATNVEYRWKMLDEEGIETTDVTKAKYISTDYLSKQNEKTAGEYLIPAFDKDTMTSPAFKDVKVAFKVTEPNTSDRIIINIAEIKDDADKDGNPVVDIDSVPDNDKPNEDDIDKEYIKVKYFDLALKKWVSDVILIENGEQTVRPTGHTGDENPEPVVKVDLYRRKLNKVVVKFAYKIKITNEGEIAGYAKEVSDYIPEGLRFDQADNELWKEVDGKIVTDQLKDTLLQPGESATVDVILTWINDENNLGLKVNTAEISKDYNDSHTPDIDSTPNNKVPGEDDIDTAPVVLSIVTGKAPMYIGLTTAVLAILSTGVVMIKKFVL